MVATDSFPLLELVRDAGVAQAEFLRKSLGWRPQRRMEATSGRLDRPSGSG